MKPERFPYEAARWNGNQPERAKNWFEDLERLGPQNVGARQAQIDAGSGGAIAIGAARVMIIGFAQERLAWHDQKAPSLEREAEQLRIFGVL